jgi:alpha-L-fucosidase
MDHSHNVVGSGTSYRVALDSAILIAKSENPQQVEQPRQYWLELIRQCHETLIRNDKSVSSILKNKTEYTDMRLRG